MELKRCVVRNGAMEVVDLDYNTATGDSTVNGRPFSEAFPATAEHAMNARWYVDNEPIVFIGRRYVKYGLPRLLGSTELVPIGTYEGVTVFAEPEANLRRPEVLYLPVNPGCEFQPYEGGETGGAVRG